MMKRMGVLMFLGFISAAVVAQKSDPENTLLWKVSGNGLEKPTYLYGTMHMLCKDDATLSDNMKKAIRECDEVYFEVDLDNMFEILGAMDKLNMKGDTTLEDLLSKDDYKKVKSYFEKNGGMVPFSMLEKFKPMLAASMIDQSELPCEQTAMMEQVIMEDAKKQDKNIKGLETLAFQAGVFDSIPYKLQADQLVEMAKKNPKDKKDDNKVKELMDTYRSQDMKKIASMMNDDDPLLSKYIDILLYHRNENWVRKLKGLMPKKSLLVAVGAGHLPGERGVIDLLRKEGFTVTPVDNKTRTAKEI